MRRGRPITAPRNNTDNTRINKPEKKTENKNGNKNISVDVLSE